MKISLRGLALLAASLLALSATAAPRKTENVVFIVSDGLRWQEVFNGAEKSLLNDKEKNWRPVPELRQKYWNDDPKVRRKLLFPFLWGTIATQGQIFGNPALGSVASVQNPLWFSYPGYNEMTTGVVDPKITKNEFGPNPNTTVYEWLNQQPAFKGKVEVFGTWGVFHDIFNDKRSHLPVHAGPSIVDPTDRSPEGLMFEELYRTTTHVEDDDPFDAFLHVALRRHLKSHHPRVLFVGYGDTDSWAHTGRYDLLMDTIQGFDAFVGDLWNQMQAMPEYRGKTTFILTADHGRGNAPVKWMEHGVEQPGSDKIWVAMMGPDTPALGERSNVPAITQAQLAATVADLLGLDYRKAKPEAAPSMLPLVEKK
ncbi:MAG: AP protein [Pseudomonadota bacterium]